MRLQAIPLAICLTALPVLALGQVLTPSEFHNLEWQMKANLWKHQQERAEPRLALDMADYDVKYWELDINVTNINGQIISGRVTMISEVVVASMNQIEYDLHTDMVADSVRVAGQSATFSHPVNLLTITLDRTYNTGELITTVVYYHGHPLGGGFGSFSWDTHNGQPIVSTLSEPEGAREWWPCKDQPHDKADSADVKITVDSILVATSNGLLVSNNNNGDGTRTFHWHISYPITTYLISLAITNYQSFTNWYVNAQGDSMPVTNYVYPEHYNQAVEDLSITPSAIAFFAGRFGEYPFINEKYGHSIFPWGGAMEHQCNTSYGQWLIRGDHAYDWIVVHELSHMWFGDMITCDIWPEIWMNEGFASYCEALWTESLWGFDGYITYMTSFNSVTDPSGPIYNPNPLFDGNTVYNKGSWVLHMLRGVMGDSAFFNGMYAYANSPQHMYGTITTRAFQAIMEEYYGGGLGWYFDEWIWGQNRPHYRFSWMEEDLGNGQYEVFLHINQTQPPPAPQVFTMPVKVYIRIGTVDTVFTAFNDSRPDDFRFVVNGNPSGLLLDRYSWILKEVSSESYGMNIVTTELPPAEIGDYYETTVEARGGTPPYQFGVISGSLPPGLLLNGATGIISGTPDSLGQYSFTIRCSDSSSPIKNDTQDLILTVQDATGVDDDQVIKPSEFELLGNYPNPFNASTVISFRLARPSAVELEIYNVLGQRVEILHEGYFAAGRHSIVWNAGAAASGVYFYRVSAGSVSKAGRMVLLK